MSCGIWVGRGRRSLLAIAIALLLPHASSAALIFSGLVPPPDIATTNVSVNYVASTDAFTASGVAGQVNSGVLSVIFSGSFSLTATIDGAGDPSSGSLSISGIVPNLGINSLQVLLSASVLDVGFPNVGNDPLQFLVSITGGALAYLYPAQAGVVISGSNFGGWAGNFNNNGLGTADTAPIPEPGTGSLLALGLVALTAGRVGRRE